jgi:hypothetical protein
MNDLDPKKIFDGIHAATELIKGVRGPFKALRPLVKRVPWRGVARIFARRLRTFAHAMVAAMRLPTPWSRACLAIKFALTVIAYVAFLFCLALVVADFNLFSRAHFTPKQSVAATLLLLFAAWGTIVTFAQAEWLRFLMAKNSRIL